MKRTAFPRGGEQDLTPLEFREVNTQVLEEHERGEKDLSPPSKKLKIARIPFLAHSRLSIGMTFVGVIAEINEMSLVISLPNHLQGLVSIVQCSKFISQKVEILAAHESEENVEDMPELSSLYQVGAPCICKIISLGIDESKSKSNRIDLTMIPQLINANLLQNDLQLGACYAMEVLERLEHGWVIDTGVKDITAFCSNEDGEGRLLHVGTTAIFQIKKRNLDGRSVSVCSPSAKMTISKSTVTEVDKLHAGSMVSATITNITEQGVFITFLGYFSGTINLTHLGLSAESNFSLESIQSSFEIGTKIKCRTIYADYEKKTFGCSLAPHLLSLVSFKFPKDEQIGDFCRTSTVIRVESTVGMLVRATNDVLGYIHISKISDGILEKVPKTHRVGTIHESRVVNRNFCDGILILSMQPKVLTQRYVRLQDIPVGEVIKAIIVKIEPFGVLARITDTITGLCPSVQMSDVTLSNPEKTFKIGSSVTFKVLSKNLTEKRLILTHKKSLINTKLKQLMDYSDAVPGDVTQGVITAVNAKTFGCIVQFFNQIRAIVPPSELSHMFLTPVEITANFKVGMPVKCRIISVDADQEKMKASFKISTTKTGSPPSQESSLAETAKDKSSLRNSIDSVVKCMADLQPGTKVKGKVISVKSTQINIRIADNLKGRVHISQVFHKLGDIPDITAPLRAFKSGQEIECCVVGFHDMKTHKFLPFSHRTNPGSVVVDLSIMGGNGKVTEFDELMIGSEQLGFIQKVDHDALWVHLGPKVLGRANVFECSRDVEVLSNLKASFMEGQAVVCQVMAKNVEKHTIDISLIGNTAEVLINTIAIGDVVCAKILNVDPTRGASVKFCGNLHGRIHLTDFSIDFIDNMTDMVKPDQFVKATVVSVVVERKLINLSLKPFDKNTDEVKPISGDIIKGFVKSMSEKGCFVDLSRNKYARVKISDLSDSFIKDWKTIYTVGKLVTGKILSVDLEKNQYEMSLKKSSFDPAAAIVEFTDLVVGEKVGGQIRKIEKYGIFIHLNNSKISGLCHISQVADHPVQNLDRLYAIGDSVRVVILDVDTQKQRVSLSLKASHFELGEANDLKSNVNESKVVAMDVDSNLESDIDMMNADESDSDQDSEQEKVERKPPASSKAVFSSALTSISNPLQVTGFSWSHGEIEETVSLSGESSDEDLQDSKSKSRRQKRRQQDLNEERVLKQEENVLDPTQTPEMPEDFERMLIGTPNSSFIWIKYMAYLLELAEPEKARLIAERALKIINFREEQEKLNIWVAYLNLENGYGTPDSLTEIFERACQVNDSKKVHLILAQIYEQSEKPQMVESCFKKICKKFNQSSKVWIKFASFYMRVKKPEDARLIFAKSLQSLPKRKHVKNLTKYAQMEFKLGDAERGRTIFEGLVSSYPKRTDIWSVYCDMEIKAKEMDVARRLLERLLQLAWPSKNMKFFLKKYLEFEKKHGSAEGVDHVKNAAMRYVQSLAD